MMYSFFLKLIIKVIPWLVIGGLYLLIRFAGTSDTIDWASSTASIITVWVSGAILITIFYQFGDYLSYQSYFRKQPYGMIVILRVVVVFCGMLFLSLLSRIVAYLYGQIGADDIFSSYIQRLTEIPTLIVFLYLIIATSILSFIKQMSFMMGEKVLFNLLIGKYRFPRDEERIFMFLDLKDSTRHAEALGHTQFSRLIQDCFHDLTESAIECEVEIYHYVGDEAILTWELNNGLKKNNCIRVYYHFKEKLNKRKDYYQKTYGLNPVFKAGVNMGPVTVAEIGDIKRDIAYLSDVLNTASEIQGACNHLKESLLVSADIKDKLNPDPGLDFHSHGIMKFQGKQRSVELYGIVPSSAH